MHLPAFLVDHGLSVDADAWALGVIGLFNIVGSVLSAWFGDRMPKRRLLSIIYALRSIAVIVFVTLPVTKVSAIVFGAAMGLLWLSTVLPTYGLVALIFGSRWMARLFGFALFSHQVGGFLGVWLGGVLYETTGSYNWAGCRCKPQPTHVVSAPCGRARVAPRMARTTAMAVTARLAWRHSKHS